MTTSTKRHEKAETTDEDEGGENDLPWTKDLPEVDPQVAANQTEVWAEAMATQTPIVASRYALRNLTMNMYIAGSPLYGVVGV